MKKELLISIPRDDFNSPIIAIYLLLSLLLLIYISFHYKLYLKNIILSNFSFRLLKNFNKEDSNVSKKASVWFNLFFLMSANLIVYFCVKYVVTLNWQSDWVALGLSTLITFSVFLIKFAFKVFLGRVFKTQGITRLYFSHTSIRDKGFSVLVFPLLFLFEFNASLKEFSVVLGVVILFVYLAFRWISGVLVGFKLGDIPFFYSILYICTLEILPFGIAFKALGKIL